MLVVLIEKKSAQLLGMMATLSWRRVDQRSSQHRRSQRTSRIFPSLTELTLGPQALAAAA